MTPQNHVLLQQKLRHAASAGTNSMSGYIRCARSDGNGYKCKKQYGKRPMTTIMLLDFSSDHSRFSTHSRFLSALGCKICKTMEKTQLENCVFFVLCFVFDVTL